MQKNFLDELRWRGLINDIIPETEKVLLDNSLSGYIGFDPTSDSLHIGSLVQIIILMHFQKFGHRPIILLGGATGMIGDPSGKSKERNLLDNKILEKNCQSIKLQMEKFLDFDVKKSNFALIVNNYDWMKNFSLVDFSREVGKHITVNYMIAKDSVKKRLGKESNEGMSFTEFTYQLIQGYDFLYLFNKYDCKIQIGGSDQWGNITTGTELIRRKNGEKAYAITCPLVKKVDGTKFGKTEEGNIWLDKRKTSSYKFYQYWLNTSDEDAFNYIKIFTLLEKARIDKIIAEHKINPHQRLVQKTLADEVTLMVHGKEDLENVKVASQILFGQTTKESLSNIDSETFLEIFESVPHASFKIDFLNEGVDIVSLLSIKTNFLKSNSEARRALKEDSISVNKLKVDETYIVSEKDLIADNCILIQRGKKNYFLIKVLS
jgi:tyrosyl-tRNA synthetase